MKYFTYISIGFLMLFISINAAAGKRKSDIVNAIEKLKEIARKTEGLIHSLPDSVVLRKLELDLSDIESVVPLNLNLKGWISLSDIVISGLSTVRFSSSISSEGHNSIKFMSEYNIRQIVIAGNYKAAFVSGANSIIGSGRFAMQISNLRASDSSNLTINFKTDKAQISDMNLTVDFSSFSLRADWLMLNAQLISWRDVNGEIKRSLPKGLKFIKEELIPQWELQINAVFEETPWSKIGNWLENTSNLRNEENSIIQKLRL